MMMMLLLMISLLTSMFMVTLKHPMSLGATLLSQTISTSLIMGFFNLNYWYSYILFLIMIGGMLVLFIYMTSVASNELFFPSIKLFFMSILIILLFSILYMNMDNYYLMINNIYEQMNNQNNYTLSLNKYLNFPNNLISYMLIIYLLITLLAVVKITNFKMGALRSSN